MKKSLLIACILAATVSANAQVSLSGSSYSENFNSLATAMPTGWRVYDSAAATRLGTLRSVITAAASGIFNDTSCGANNVTSGGFKNYASANVATQGMACGTQITTSDRALGVRQVSSSSSALPMSDSGAAFVLVIANTMNRTAFNLAFKLQSLDTSSPRTTTWNVDYAVGTPPTSFTTVTTTPATLTTGGHAFSNTSVTASFGSALDNKSDNVYIRVVALKRSTGSGNRPSTAIDDVTLTWTNSSNVGVANVNASTVPFQVLGAATSSTISFGCEVAQDGDFTLALSDMTGRTVYSQNMHLVAGVHVLNASDVNIVPGMYVARLTNGKTQNVTRVVVQ